MAYLRSLAQPGPLPAPYCCLRLYQKAEPLALISSEAMKSHLQRINAALSWPEPARLLEERSLESNLLGRHLPENPLTKSNYALRGRLK